MAIRRIRIAGDPVLRRRARKVKKIDSLVLHILDDLADTMRGSTTESITGVGLAAPQVGIPQRLIVVDIGQGLYKMINPVILEKQGSVIEYEGCLSCPNQYGEVERAKSVLVRYMDEKGKTCRLEAEDFLARVLLHEIDHLDGILFIDIAKNIITREDMEEEQIQAPDESELPPIWEKL